MQRFFLIAKILLLNSYLSPLKTQLQDVNQEVGGVSDQLERLNKNGQTLAEKAASAADREVVLSTCNSLTDQMGHVRHMLEQKKMAVSLQKYFVIILNSKDAERFRHG